MNKLIRIAEEPYRIFFPLGVVWGIVGVSHWLFYGLGWISTYSMLMHSSIQTQAYMMCFVLGFLLTAMPKFAAAPPLSVKEFALFLLLMIWIPLFYLRENWLAGRISFAVTILLLARFAALRFLRKKNTNIEPPVQFVWIPVAFFHGLAGTLLSILGGFIFIPSELAKAGKLLVEQGFILSLALGVGSFLGPRLMGSFQPLVKIGELSERVSQIRKKKMLICAAGGVLLFLSYFLESYDYKFPAFLIRSILITLIYFPTRTLILQPLVQDQFVRLLWVSFWMVFIGHWAIVFFPAFRAVLMHLVFLGGYSLMTFAVGTMVIFSHGGLSHQLKKPHWVLTSLFVLTAAALVLRVSSVFFPVHYFRILATSSSLWSVAAVLWLGYVLPVAFRFVSAEEFERCHDEAKRRVKNLRSGKPVNES